MQDRDGQDEADFAQDYSFSFWEYVPGANVMVTADDAVEGRYHITAKDGGHGNGWITDSQGVEELYPKDYPDIKVVLDETTRAAVIAQYEGIRALPKFSPRQCPIMELQVGEDGEIYFLQYHKARPFRPSPIRLDSRDYEARDGWHKADAVRGALGSLVTLKAAMWYPQAGNSDEPTYEPQGIEEASYDLHWDIGLTEFVSRSRIAYINPRGRQWTYMSMADGKHELRSRWFKPSGSVIVSPTAHEAMISREKQKALRRMVNKDYQMGRFVVDIASDGSTGYMRLNPDQEEQPVHTSY
jgi:hypothetical protein